MKSTCLPTVLYGIIFAATVGGTTVTLHYGHKTQGTEALSPFLIGRTFVREHSWEYSANIVGS